MGWGNGGGVGLVSQDNHDNKLKLHEHEHTWVYSKNMGDADHPAENYEQKNHTGHYIWFGNWTTSNLISDNQLRVK